MKLDEVANSGNDEFYTPLYAIKPLEKYLNSYKVVWCPFDTEKSLIVKRLKELGFCVIPTHLETGHDFFTMPVPDCDIIVSNPPYSLKTEVFQRLFLIGKPFAMLVGVVGLFESKKRFNLFKNNKFEIMWLSKRVAYFKDYNDEKPSLNPPFSSVWLCSNLLEEENAFEEITK